MKCKQFIVISLALCCLVFSSCTTTKGGTFEKTSSADKKMNWADSASSRIITDEKNVNDELTIFTIPDNADVYVDNKYYGKSPVTIPGLADGTYQIRIERQDYETYEEFIQYNKENMTYKIELARLTGFIDVESDPANAEVTLGGDSIETGQSRVPVGSYDLSVRLWV